MRFIYLFRNISATVFFIPLKNTLLITIRIFFSAFLLFSTQRESYVQNIQPIKYFKNTPSQIRSINE